MNVTIPEVLPVPEDDEPVAAHVYRDGRIIHTVIIERAEDDEGLIWYTAYSEGQKNRPLVQRPSMDEVQNLMDHYLQGFAEAYDAVMEGDLSHAACKRHRYDTAEARDTGRCSVCRHRAATRPRQRRDRTDVEGTGEGNSPH